MQIDFHKWTITMLLRADQHCCWEILHRRRRGKCSWFSLSRFFFDVKQFKRAALRFSALFDDLMGVGSFTGPSPPYNLAYTVLKEIIYHSPKKTPKIQTTSVGTGSPWATRFSEENNYVCSWEWATWASKSCSLRTSCNTFRAILKSLFVIQILFSILIIQ